MRSSRRPRFARPRLNAGVRRHVKRLVQTLVWLAPLLLLAHWGREFLAADACLDGGKVYDYGAGACRSDIEHFPYSPYLARYWWLVAVVAGIVASGVVVHLRERPK
jgi:hypothetical protein